MSRVIRPNDAWSRINGLEGRLANMERVSQLKNSNITDGFLQVSDPDGNIRLQIGKLGGDEIELGGDYGIYVYDATGANPVQIQPPLQISVPGTVSTTVESYGSIAGFDFLAPIVSVAEQMLVITSSTILIDGSASDASSWEGRIAARVDSNDSLIFAEAPLASGLEGSDVRAIKASVSASQMVTGLTKGAHAVELVALSLHGQSIHFTNSSLIVIPY